MSSKSAPTKKEKAGPKKPTKLTKKSKTKSPRSAEKSQPENGKKPVVPLTLEGKGLIISCLTKLGLGHYC